MRIVTNKNERTVTITKGRILGYFATLEALLRETEATEAHGEAVELERAFSRIAREAKRAHEKGNKLMFVGNGGSAAIASHMAIDYSKSGNLRSVAFNDGAALTCLGNDLGYDNVFAKQIEMHGRTGDVLIAISSSGSSASILRAVEAAQAVGCFVVTLSGFSPDNPLRRLGALNLYVQSSEYGFVEVSHLALCHAVLDLATGAPAGT